MKIRKAIRPLLRGMLWVSQKMQGYKIEIMNQTEIPQGKPIIFAVSHIAKLDFEKALRNGAISKELIGAILCYADVRNGQDITFVGRLIIVIYRKLSWNIGI